MSSTARATATCTTRSSNDPSKLHSETIAIKQIAEGDPNWRKTEILELYTERHPCANCGPDLEAVRREIKRRRAARGQSVTDFPVFYSVPKWEKGDNRAADLQGKYLGKLNPPVKPVKPVKPPEPKPPAKQDNRPLVQIRKGKRPDSTAADAPPTKTQAAPEAPVTRQPSPPPTEPPAATQKTSTAAEMPMPKINLKAAGKMVGGSVVAFVLGAWLGSYTQEAVQKSIRRDLERMQPEIDRRMKEEFDRVSALGWAQMNPRPPWYIYVTIDIWRLRRLRRVPTRLRLGNAYSKPHVRDCLADQVRRR